MWTRQHKQRNTGRLIVPAVSALFLAYFGFHAYHGEFGIYSNYQFESRAAELRQRLETVRSQRLQARRALNLSQSDEITIMLPAHGGR